MIPEKDWYVVHKHVVEGSQLHIITMARLLGIQRSNLCTTHFTTDMLLYMVNIPGSKHCQIIYFNY